MTSTRCSMLEQARDGVTTYPANRPPQRCPDPVRFVCRDTTCYLCERCAEWTRKTGVVLVEVRP